MYNLLDSNLRFRIHSGIDKFHAAGYYGQRVTAATGEYPSPAIAESMGYSLELPFPESPASGFEVTSHSTRTALVFWQIAPKAKLVALPVLFENGISLLVTKAIPYAAAHGIPLMFASLTYPQSVTKYGIDDALNKVPGLFYAMGAGNDGENGYNKFPVCENIYGVGAYYLSPNGSVTPAEYTSASEYVDFAAPTLVSVPSGTGEFKLSGTSCATPYLIGMCALVQDFFIHQTGRPLNRDALYQFLKDYSVDIGDPGQDIQTGCGAVVLPDPATIDVWKYQTQGEPMHIIEEQYAWAYPLTPRTTTTHLIIHHEATSGSTAQQIHAYHLSKGWAGIAYNLYIRKDGRIYRGRPENMIGGHTTNYNHCSIGLCFEGNFDTETMPRAQIEAGKWAVADILSRYPGLTVCRHSDLNATACPGKNFPFAEITQEEPEMRYNTIDEIPAWGKPTIQKLIDKGALKGTGEGFNISEDMLRMFVINDRMGLYGEG